VLWDRFDGQVHGELKNTLSPVLSQCVTERVVRSIGARANPQRATTQVRNLALAVLTEAGVQPWVLADMLHHDLHIGIDLLFGCIGYHFLYGTDASLSAQSPALLHNARDLSPSEGFLKAMLKNPHRPFSPPSRAVLSSRQWRRTWTKAAHTDSQGGSTPTFLVLFQLP
jgi:hypothetical protein